MNQIMKYKYEINKYINCQMEEGITIVLKQVPIGSKVVLYYNII